MVQIYVYSILVLILIGFCYFFYLRDKFQKQVKGHVWATFITKGGVRVEELCRVDGNKVIPPLGLLTPELKPTLYLIGRKKTADYLYPPKFPKVLQAPVRSIIYGEGNGEPYDPDEENPPVYSDQLMANLLNASDTLQILKGMIAATRTEDLLATLEKIGGSKTVIYICAGLAVGLVVLGLFMFKLSGQVGDLSNLIVYGG